MEECERVIREGWEIEVEGSKIDQVIRKLGVCRKLLKEWSKKAIPNNQKAIDELM